MTNHIYPQGMKPRYIFDNISANQKIDVVYDHSPCLSYEINCPYCQKKTNTVPEIYDSSKTEIKNVLTDMYHHFFCDTCKWDLRHRFLLKLAANDIINKDYNLIYMPSEYAVSIALIKKYLNDKKYCKIFSSNFTEITYNKYKLEVDQYLENSYQDLTKLSYQDCFFDYIHCNHMLEHIPDYKLAIQNLYRVLRFGGELVITVPINYSEEFNTQWAVLNEEKINWIYFPYYHDMDSPVFWNFGIELISYIKNTLNDAKITFENFIDHDIGLYNQGINIIRVKKLGH